MRKSILFIVLFVVASAGGTMALSQEDRTITIFTVLGDQDAERFTQTLEPFEQETGVDISIETSQDMGSLTIRAEGNNLPDVILFPQPGLMADFARDGYLIPLDTFLDMDQYSQNFSETWVGLGSVDGELYGVPYRVSIKSLVWYPVDDFEQAGYSIPSTWDELLALTQEIADDGGTPWCIGLESGAASGWPGTDWIEDIMLRTAGADEYDRWVSGDLKFDSPEVRRAFEVFGDIALNDAYVLGGRTGALTTFFGDSPIPMFEEPPGCWLHHQASFITGYLPQELTEGDLSERWGAFYLPPIDEAAGRPVLGAGNLLSVTNDREIVKTFMQFMTTPEAYESWVKQGNFITVHQGVPFDWYPDAIIREQAEILLEADTFRFDGSDLMPGEVGTGSFWSGMLNWVGGQDLETVLKNIDATWPTD